MREYLLRHRMERSKRNSCHEEQVDISAGKMRQATRRPCYPRAVAARR